jgi:NADH-quinone oxidoreductase subunit G
MRHNCPTGALSEQNNVREVANALASDKILIAQTAPSIRATLGELLGMKPGISVTGKMVTALKELGFQKVFDTDLAADITIVEEATEFAKRLKNKENLPMITTCCPAWIKFAEQYFFEQLNHMSSCRSPQAMMASLIKTYYAEKNKIKPENIILVDIMPCTAKKYEINRPEFQGEADYVLTTVELAKLIKQHNINFQELPDSEFDNPLGESTGAGVIFGRSGGVMEAALRTAADLITGQDIKNIEYKEVRGLETTKEATINIGKQEIKVCVVHTLGEARKIMNQIRQGQSPYDFIEIMACYGGCIGGGGQPRYESDEQLKQRMQAISKEDKNKKIRKSHQNPSVIRLYKEYLGEYGGKKAHKLLHTKYEEKESI